MERVDKGLGFMLNYENVAWYENGAVKILDRRIYPIKTEFVNCKTHKDVAKAIADMVTQSGGPYAAAGMGMALAAYECRNEKEEVQREYLKVAANTIANARPTTAKRMTLIVDNCIKAAEIAFKEGKLVDEEIFSQTIKEMNGRYGKIKTIARYMVEQFPQKGGVMTQCFGESIVGFMLQEIKNQGKEYKIYCPETRPYLQGARLTSSVAIDQGFDVTVISDNMPAYVMSQGLIDVFTSAADVICMDGTIINKVGTYQIALCAKEHNIPYYVSGAPDKGYKSTADVKIEMRNGNDVLNFMGIKTTKEGVKGLYPAFDITPPKLVTGIATDKGVYTSGQLAEYYLTGGQGEY